MVGADETTELLSNKFPFTISTFTNQVRRTKSSAPIDAFKVDNDGLSKAMIGARGLVAFSNVLIFGKSGFSQNTLKYNIDTDPFTLCVYTRILGTI